jgi:hypothetical protein
MIKIKSSVLIWFVRSRGRAVAKANNGFGGLGMLFYDLIVKRFGGRIINTDVPFNPAQAGIVGTIGQFGLPLTSAEYELPINQWPNLLAVTFAIP